MIYLARHLDADYHGVTISRVQAELGRRFVAERGLETITIEDADFSDAAYWDARPERFFDAAYAVESSIHVHDILARLPLLASRLRPGATFIVVDDMISRAAARRWPSRRERRWLREFEKGWYAHGLVSLEQMVAAAEEAGLVLREARDLTPYLELGRPRDRLARVFVSGLRWLPLRLSWFDNLLGGNALQLALKRKLLGYYYLVFTVEKGRRSG
jgi:cyclopropane fatty-acyl-phospholipid synthase-like methyltransferase